MQVFTKILNNKVHVLLLLFLSVATVSAFAQQGDTLNIPKEEVVEPENKTLNEVIVPQQRKDGILVKGTITDASTGDPLSGIMVSFQDYSASITDESGSFSIAVPSLEATIQVTGEGYQKKEIPIKGRSEIAVSLHKDDFNSVYRNAYLSSSQKMMTHVVNSVVSINTVNKFQTSSETPENIFQGKVAGLNMTRRSGMPGIGTFMSLRGYNSLYATNQPLVVVDGMIYDMNDYGGSIIKNYFSNPLEYIDVKDIDNITVVKDATSLYGAKGANGAIIITTGHAQDLATKIDFALYTGFNYAPKKLPVMGPAKYRTYLSDVLKSAGYSDSEIQAQPYMNDDPSSETYYKYHNNTDWQDQVFGNSTNQNYYIRVSGGDNIAKYFLSVGYAKYRGVVKNTDMSRKNIRFNADLNISPRLTGNTNLSYTDGEHNLIEDGLADKTNPIALALAKAPFLNPHEISDEGLISPNLADIDILSVGNPAQIVRKMTATNKNYRFFGSVNFNYRISDTWNASTLFGVTYDKNRENLFIPQRGVIPDTLYNALAESRMGAQLQRTFSAYSDTRVSFNRTFNHSHEVLAKAGVRIISNKSEEDYGLGFNSATDDLQTIGTGVNSLRQVGGTLGRWSWINYYATVDYSYRNKYFVSANLAIDGSSRFGKEARDGIKLYNHKFGLFSSLGASWLVSSENFMANNDFIELLKLRVNYGVTGNDDIGNYNSKQFYVSQNLLGVVGIIRGNIANPALQWETVKKLNGGVDVALMNERITVSLDVYYNKTINMITYQPIESISGFDYVITNNGAMENKGVELAVNSRVLDNDFKLDLGLNLAAYRNEVTKLPVNNLEARYAGATVLTSVGKPVGVFYGYKTSGVYSSDDQANEDGYSTRSYSGDLTPFQGGDVRFADLVSDGVIDDKDRTVIGDPNPDFTGMFTARLGWKRFTFDAALMFSYGNDVYNYQRAQLESMKNASNQTITVLNRWRTDGQITNVPKATWGDPLGNARFSDRWIEDGSYLRLRTLSVSYELPYKVGILKYATVYLTGNNLLTFSKYLGYDPEFSASNNVLLQGIDTGITPQYRSIMIGVRVGL